MAVTFWMTAPVSADAFCFDRLRCSALASSGGPVMEDDVGPQGDDPRGEVGIGGDRLRQVGLPPTGGRDDGYGVEDGEAIEIAAFIPAGPGRVESTFFGVDAEDDGAPLLRLGGRDAIASRTVRDRPSPFRA